MEECDSEAIREAKHLTKRREDGTMSNNKNDLHR